MTLVLCRENLVCACPENNRAFVLGRVTLTIRSFRSVLSEIRQVVMRGNEFSCPVTPLAPLELRQLEQPKPLCVSNLVIAAFLERVFGLLPRLVLSFRLVEMVETYREREKAGKM